MSQTDTQTDDRRTQRCGISATISTVGPPIGNGLWGIQWSRDRDESHMTPKGQTRNPNTLRANIWKTVIAT